MDGALNKNIKAPSATKLRAKKEKDN